MDLRIIKFNPETPNNETVFFVPGWIVDIKNFMATINQFTDMGYRVVYTELRDKASSKFSRKFKVKDFHIDRYVDDLDKIIKELKPSKFHLFASSLGASIVAGYLTNTKTRKPISSTFVIPAIDISFNYWQKIFIRIPLIFEWFIVKLVAWYLKKQFFNPEEPETEYVFQEKLYDIDLRKNKCLAIAMDRIGGLKLENFDIQEPVLLIGAINDLMHPIEEIQMISKIYPLSTMVDLYSTLYTHSEMSARIVDRYSKGLEFDDILAEIKRD